jgi:Zn finger protein HypA/HybF involved in hydrogenase expression
MHELSLVEELVAVCRHRAQGRSVRQVCVRCPASVDAADLSEGFALTTSEAALAGDKWLAGAELKVEPVPVMLRCPCGFEGELSREHVAGHVSICPHCGQVGEAAGRLELVSINFCGDVEPFGPT